MKKNHPPGGVRISLRLLLYGVAFIAMIGTRETLTDGTGPVSKTLGKVFNETLMASSKLALGVALMSHDQGNKDSMLAKGSRMLGLAAHKAYVSAAKVNLFAR